MRLTEEEETRTGGSPTDLVSQAREGDQQALSALLDAHYDLVRRSLYRLLGPNDDLDDLQQTVLMRIVTSLESFRGDSAFKTWVVGICTHVARDYLRRKKVRRVVQLASNPEDCADTDATRSRRRNTVELSDDVQSARRALDQLSVKHRTVLVLRLAFGYSVDEIATMTKSAKSTTRMRLYYARRAFTKALSRDSP